MGVSAHQHEHNWKVAMVNKVYKPLFGQSLKGECPDDLQTYSDGHFIRKLMGSMHVSSIMAAYNLEENPLPEECFGDWIDAMWAPIHNVGHKWHTDPWSVEKKEWEEAGQAWLDMTYKNADYCKFQKIGDNMVDWCLGEEAMCFRWDGVFKRVFANAWELINADMDMFHILKHGDPCMSDDDLILEYSQFYYDVILKSRIYHGIDVDWNTDSEHMSLKDFKDEERTYKKNNHPWFAKMIKFGTKLGGMFFEE